MKILQFPTNEAPASTAQRVVDIVAIVATIGHAGFPPLEAIKEAAEYNVGEFSRGPIQPYKNLSLQKG